MEPSSNPSSSTTRKTNLRPSRVVSSKSSSWCCSFNIPPKSPEALSKSASQPRGKPLSNAFSSDILSKSLNGNNSFPNSPQSSKSGLGLVGRLGPRRILSPGRISPIDSDSGPTSAAESIHALMSPEPAAVDDVGPVAVSPESEGCSVQGVILKQGIGGDTDMRECGGEDSGDGGRAFDVRLNLKGKRGACLALELSSDVLCRNSPLFADLISDHCRKSATGGPGRADLCRIEVPEVDNLGVFRDTIELMFEDDITKQLLKVGVSRALDILEVSTAIKFCRCISSCLKYIEAVPWGEDEEEKLRRLFNRYDFEDEKSKEIMCRLNFSYLDNSQLKLASQLVWSITTCANTRARNELKSMVKGLLSKSSIYEKDHLFEIKEEELYHVSCHCLDSLTSLFEEASGTTMSPNIDLTAGNKKNSSKTLVESIAWQVDNLSWLLEILLDRQMAEKFVDIWADQKELLRMHGIVSPMVRYELSRVSAVLFIAMGMRKLQCRSGSRVGLLKAWFGPMLLDFGWLQRCRKGLSVRELEEAMGQAVLTLPLMQQYDLFMEWFKHFSQHGRECPNLSKAFQIWWRRTFLRGFEMPGVESG